MGNRLRMTAALAALTMTAGLACAASAQADIRLGVNVQLGVNLSAPYIEGVLSGQTQPLDSAGNLVCEPGQTVGGYLPGGQPVSQALCAIPALDYQYVTRFKKSGGGQLVRRHTALVNVPTPLSVDEDLAPDVIATLQVLSPSQVSLKIDRVLTELSTLPLKIEAIVDDPTAGALPRENINVGYDARDSRAPSSWRATTSLPNDGSDALTTLEVVKEVLGAGTTITTLGGLFDGDSLKRKDPMGGAITYTPVPTHATLGLTLGSYMEVRAGANLPVGVKARAEIVGGPRERLVAVNLAGLPRTLSVRVEEPAASQRTVTYAAAAGVPSLDATYTDSTGGVLGTKVVAKASGIPTGMVLKQTSARAGTLQATGGTLGSVEVGYANGEPRLLDADHPYARIFDDGTLKSYAGRIDALQSASIDATTKVTGELVLGPGARKPLRALVDMPGGRHIDANLKNLPRHLNVLYDADGGLIDYNAFGETIDEITVEARQDTPFFGRVTRLHGTIAGLPPTQTINFRQFDGALTLAATNPIGTITLLASDGSDAPAVDGSYAWYEDTASRYRAFARISGLKAIAFSPSPATGSIDTATAQVLNLHGEAGGVTVDGKIDKLPSHVEFTVPDDRVHIETSDPIDHINLQARNLPGGAPFRNAKVDIFGISPVLDIYLGVEPTTAAAAAGGQALADGESTSRLALDQNCPPEEEPCEEPPPCPPEEEPCEEEPPPPPPPPPPPDPKLYGIDAHGDGIDLITIHAWADDADLPSHPDLTGPGNEIRYDAKVAGHEDLRARIVNLKHAFYTQDAVPTGPNGYPVPNGTDDVDIEFTQPEPITLGIKKERLDGTLTIPRVAGRQLPTKYGLRLGTKRVINAIFTPNATIPTVELAMAVGKDLDGGERRALITGHVDNIPTQTEVCIAQDGFPDCGGWLFDAPGGKSNVVIPGEIDFNLASNGPPVTDPNAMSVNARICLGDIGSNAWVPGSCELDQVAKKYIDIDNLRVRNFDLEYRGDGVAHKYQDNFGSDDSLAAYLSTDGILVDDFRYVKDDGKGVQFIKADQPLTAQDFFAAVNYSASVRAGFMHGPIGNLSCPGDTSLYLLERDSATGEVSRYDIPILPDNLWTYIEPILDC